MTEESPVAQLKDWASLRFGLRYSLKTWTLTVLVSRCCTSVLMPFIRIPSFDQLFLLRFCSIILLNRNYVNLGIIIKNLKSSLPSNSYDQSDQSSDSVSGS